MLLLFPFSSTFELFVSTKKLNVQCDGEAEMRYHGVWLRHNCRCPVCLSPDNQNVVHHSSLIDLKIMLHSVMHIRKLNYD